MLSVVQSPQDMSHDVARLILQYAKEIEEKDIAHLKRYYTDRKYALYCDLKNIISKAILDNKDKILLSDCRGLDVGMINNFTRPSYANATLYPECGFYTAVGIQKYSPVDHSHIKLVNDICIMFQEGFKDIFDKILKDMDVQLVYKNYIYAQPEVYLSWRHWK